MRKNYGRKATMAQKVLNFCRQLTWDHPEFVALVAQLAEVLARLLDLDTQSRAGHLTMTGATMLKRRYRNELHSEFLSHFARIGAAHFRGQPELQARFVEPERTLAVRKFVTRVRTIMEDVEAHREVFLRYDMPPDFLAQFTAAVERYETAPEAAVAGLTARSGATAEQGEAAKELMSVVTRLNALIRNHYRGDLETLTAWKVIRKIPWERPPRLAPPARENPAA